MKDNIKADDFEHYDKEEMLAINDNDQEMS